MAQVEARQREFARAQMEANRQQAIRLEQLRDQRANRMMYLQQVFANNQAAFNQAMAFGDVYRARIFQSNCAMALNEYNAQASSPR